VSREKTSKAKEKRKPVGWEKRGKKATGMVPEHKDEQLIAKRMGKWEGEYFRFIQEGLDPANNPAELMKDWQSPVTNVLNAEQ
jgi:hypothetical protein